MYLRSLEILRNENTDPKTYPFSIPAVKILNSLSFRSNITFFVGENGSGKSTLLEAIAYQCGFNTAGGGKNNNYDVDSSYSALGDSIRLSWLPKITNGFFLKSRNLLSLCFTFGHYYREVYNIMVDVPYIINHMEKLFFLSLTTDLGKRRFICWMNLRLLFHLQGN